MRTSLLALTLIAACGGTKPAPTEQPSKLDPGTAADPVATTPPVAPPKPTGHPATDLIARSVLFGNPERTNVQLSPDGKYVSWLAPKDNVLNIWFAPIDHLDQAKPITSDTSRPIRQYFWAFTNKHVLYLQDTGGDENFHLFRVDLADAKTTDLTPYKATRTQLYDLSEKQPTTVMVGLNDRDPKLHDLYKLDLATGKRTLVVQNDDNLSGYTLDDKLAVRLARKQQPDGSIQMFVRDGNAWKLWDTIPSEDSLTTNVDAITPDGKSVWITDSRGRDTGALVETNLATKKPKLIAEDPHADVEQLLEHPTKHTIQAVAFFTDKRHWTVLDKSIQQDVDGIGKLADGGNWAVASRTLDDKTWLLNISGPQHPARYFVWNRAKHAGTFLFAAQPALDQQPLVDMFPKTIKSRDGLELVSYLTLPRTANPDASGRPQAPAPLVLLVHGGPWGRDMWGYNPFHQLLANRGYAVLSVNYRGSAGFGKKFINAGNLEWSKKMHDDLLDAVTWAIDQKITSKDSVCIAGGSYGGYATLVGLAMTPDVFRCGVDIVGPSNLITLLHSIPPYWAPLLAMFKTRVGDPDTAEGKALLTAASPLTHAANIAKPLLIGQGANDPRVKQAEAEQIVKAMNDHHLPVTYVVFPDEGHGFARPDNNIAFTGVMEAFLSAHLGGTYLPLTAEEVKASSMDIKQGKDGIPGLP